MTAKPEHRQEDSATRLGRHLRTKALAERAAPFIDARVISEDHLQLADTLGHAAGEAGAEAILVAAMVLAAHERGHSALSLDPAFLPRLLAPRMDEATDPPELYWPEVDLSESPLLHSEPPILILRPDTHMGPLLQAQRFDQEEIWVADALKELTAEVPEDDRDFLRLQAHHVEQLGRGLFTDWARPEIEHPALGALTALANARLAIITGGPGTGKTWSIQRILAVFLVAAAEVGQPFTVALAAPTGKAGVRMREALGENLSDLHTRLCESREHYGLDLDPDAVVNAVKSQGSSTLHGLIGLRPGQGSARHGRANPLPVQLVIVDEASMADLPMMRRLLHAIGPSTRLVLLGDRDQLPSVDVGAVLSDLVAPTWRGEPNPLPVTRFTVNYRSEKAKTLAELVAALQDESDPARAGAVPFLMEKRRCEGDDFPHRIHHLAPPAPLRGDIPEGCEGTHDALVEALLAPWREDLLEDNDGNRSMVKGYVDSLEEIIRAERRPSATIAKRAEKLFERFDAYRVLAVHRAGPLGVAGLRRGLEKKIRALLDEAWANRPRSAKAGNGSRSAEGAKATKASTLPTRAGKWLGQAILITQNDSDLGVYNGDVGLVLPDPERGHRLALALPKIAEPDAKESQAGLRYLSLERLPDHEGAFVMTVHKAQGSQFEHTAVVLSTKPSPIQTRELVYTGITRAKQKVTWVGTCASLEQALATRVLRGSFLEERITGEQAPRPALPAIESSERVSTGSDPRNRYSEKENTTMQLLSPLPTALEYLRRLREDLQDAKLVRFVVAYVSEPGLESIGMELLAQALKNPHSFGVASLSCSCGFQPLLKLQMHLEPERGKLKYFVDPVVLDTEGDPDLSLVHSKITYIVRSDGKAVVYLGSHNWSARALGPNAPRNAEASLRVELDFDEAQLTGSGDDFASEINRHLLQCFRLGASLDVHRDNVPIFEDWYRARCEREKPLPLDEYAVVIGVCGTHGEPSTYDHLWSAVFTPGASLYLPSHDEHEGQILRRRQDRVLVMAWTSEEALSDSRAPVLLFCKVTRQVAGAASTFGGTSEGDIENFDLVLRDEVQKQRVAAGDLPGEAQAVTLHNGQVFEYFQLNSVSASTTAAAIDGPAVPKYQNYLQVYQVLLPEWLGHSEDPASAMARERMVDREKQAVWSAKDLALTSTRQVQPEVSKNYRVPEEQRQLIMDCFQDFFGLDKSQLRVRPVDPDVAPKELVRLAESKLHYGYVGDKELEDSAAFYSSVRPGRLGVDIDGMKKATDADDTPDVEPRVQQLFAEQLREILQNVGIDDPDLDAWEAKPPRRKTRMVETVRLKLFDLADVDTIPVVVRDVRVRHEQAGLADYALLKELLLLAVSIQGAGMVGAVGQPLLRRLFEDVRRADTGFFCEIFVQSLEALAQDHCAGGWPKEPAARSNVRRALTRFLKSHALGDDRVWQLLCLEYLRGILPQASAS